MNRKTLIIALLALVALLGAACGQDQKYGSEAIEDIKEQQDAQRLGQRTPDPTPDKGQEVLNVGGTPTPMPQPTPTAAPEYFDVALVPDSPFYEPGNQVAIRAGVTLRVTNKDGTSERSEGRSYTAKSGAFDSGVLKPGETWTQLFTTPGRFEIVDQGLPFATAVLEVVA
ncbi:MAG: cupredoxin domain-containing protein [Candidatus Binatia bacterium]